MSHFDLTILDGLPLVLATKVAKTIFETLIEISREGVSLFLIYSCIVDTSRRKDFPVSVAKFEGSD